MKLTARALVAYTTSLAFLLAGCGGSSDDSSSTNNGSDTTTVTAPSITAQPASATIVTGTSTSLSVIATGTGITYQWYKDSAAITGATSATYTASVAGTYYVVVTNTAGSVTSANAVVTVTTAPVITTQPESATILNGGSQQLSVVASGTGITYQWYKDGAAISGATSATYTASASGSYTAVVTNAAGSVTSAAAVITVSSSVTAPVISTQPTARTVNAGTSTTFTVVAAGASLSYQWYKDGTAISGATSASYTIASVTTASAGLYQVVVTNSAGSATSTGVALTVNVASTGSNTAAVVNAANAFLATLSTTQKTTATSASSSTTVLFDYTLANAQQWTNLPGGRHGLRLNSSTLTAAQLTAANSVISTALSSTGQTLMDEIRLSDDVIAASTSNSPWGAALYSIAFIGTPSATSPWMLQLTGHHLAYNISYNAPMASATPTFVGVEPPNWVVNANGSYTVNNTASSSGTAHAPLEAQRIAVYNLAESIYADSTTSAAAKLSGTFSDVTMGVGNNGDSNYKTLSYPTSGRGLVYTSMNATQKAYVKAAIEAWVNTQASDVASTLLAAYLSDTALASTYVGYGVGQNGTKADFSAYPNAQSSPLNAQRSYIRIDGPRVWIEFIVQQGVAYPSYVHYHSLWRDKTADYGASF